MLVLLSLSRNSTPQNVDSCHITWGSETAKTWDYGEHCRLLHLPRTGNEGSYLCRLYLNCEVGEC